MLVGHAFRNALIPLITVLGLTPAGDAEWRGHHRNDLPWPGMGLLVIRAVSARDYPLILGTILVTATLVLISNLLADLLYAVADPRIRLSQGRG